MEDENLYEKWIDTPDNEIPPHNYRHSHSDGYPRHTCNACGKRKDDPVHMA